MSRRDSHDVLCE